MRPTLKEKLKIAGVIMLLETITACQSTYALLLRDEDFNSRRRDNKPAHSSWEDYSRANSGKEKEKNVNALNDVKPKSLSRLIPPAN